MLSILLIFLLVSNASSLRRDKSILFSRIVLNSLILISFLTYTNMYLTSLEKGIGIYGGLFNVTILTQTFNIFILIVSAVILTLTAFYPRKVHVKQHASIYSLLLYKLSYNKTIISNKMGEQFRIIEYSLVIVFIICGAMFLMSSGDLISVFLSIELQSYGLYILSTLYRNSEYSTASGLTYFLLGGLSSCFILLGSALLYANSGTTSLDNMYIITGISELTNTSAILLFYQPYYFHISLIIMSVGFLFKISAAPFHFWSPDVYDGVPTIVTTYVAIIAKISILVLFLELVYYTEYYYFDFSWKSIFILSSLFSLIIGSVLGLTQFRIKRLFAYSSISHIGFILLALSINNTESIQSYIFYILQYTLSNLNGFVILITIGFSLYIYINQKNTSEEKLVDTNNSPIQLVSQIKGYFYINPFIAISLTITLLSFIGIPPIIGFFAKQMVLSAALESGYIFMALVAIITSVIGAGYYLNLIKQIFFYKNDYELNSSVNNLTAYLSNDISNKNDVASKIIFKSEHITVNSSLSVTISSLTLLLLLFIYTPQEWFNAVIIITTIIFRV
jgi:NADH-ubiquinone oxidoreductase chain 2